MRCLQNCEDTGECRGAAGYICDADSTCWTGGGAVAGEGEIGGPCAADADCGADGACVREEGADGPTGFAGGYCIRLGCSANAPCPAGAECYDIGDDTACLATCGDRNDCRAGYTCQAVGACLPSCEATGCEGGEVCRDDGLCGEPPCTPNSCGAGAVCGDDGVCRADLGATPPGPAPRCNGLPAAECEGTERQCGAVVAFEPREGPGYFCNHEAYRSWARVDVRQLVQYATAAVECLTEDWNFGVGPPLGLGDMSEEDGAIPGTSIGQPGHPEGTHVDGHDMDIAYYQVGQRNNQLRPICNHIRGGEDQYHCIGEPENLDVWRTALFIGLLHASPQVRVIGVDGRVGPLVTDAIAQLCAEGWLATSACDRDGPALAYEVQDQGRGWYYFHHHHLHLSLSSRPAGGPNAPLPWVSGADACLDRACRSLAPVKILGRRATVVGSARIPVRVHRR